MELGVKSLDTQGWDISLSCPTQNSHKEILATFCKWFVVISNAKSYYAITLLMMIAESMLSKRPVLRFTAALLFLANANCSLFRSPSRISVPGSLL